MSRGSTETSVGSTAASAVVVAHQFNPSVASQKWLEENGLLRPADLEAPFAFTNAFSKFQTKDFDFLLLPDRLQFNLLAEPPYQKALVMEKVGSFVRAVPHTPYKALGLNFTYQVLSADGDTCALTRRLFFVPGGVLHEQFNDPGARFGGYMSRDMFDGRLKLTVRPTLESDKPGGPGVHYVLMEFNFHRDIVAGPKAVSQITEHLERWDDAREIARGIVDAVIAEDRQ
jgi:hypothetical protein